MDSGYVVSLTRRLRFTPQKYILVLTVKRLNKHTEKNSLTSSGLERATFWLVA
jgi:hypothetical protein